IRARTARWWLKKLGFKFGQVRKGVYIDGHEREDVVSYRNKVFIPKWNEIERRLVIFKEDGTWELPPGLRPGETALVFVTHDESTFNANDGKRRVWMENGKQPLRPKTKGKAKGLKVVLKERRLWPEGGYRPFGGKFLLECSTSYGRSGCLPKEEGWVFSSAASRWAAAMAVVVTGPFVPAVAPVFSRDPFSHPNPNPNPIKVKMVGSVPARPTSGGRRRG
ncbi:hypothetical protein FN846DRAFT_1010086, partial [Sphaerosporella brunnea]